MQNNAVRRPIQIAAFCFLTVLFSSRAFAFNSHAPFDISADQIDYADLEQSMTAEGHVVVVQGTSSLKADFMRYERQTQRLFARGHVVMNDKGSVMLGDTLDYDMNKEVGKMTSALGYQKPWIFTGETWQKELDYYIGHQVSFTSCDLVDPHFHIRSRSVHLVPDTQFWAWNNLGYIHKTPLFYSPFLYKNLARRWLVAQFRPGHDTVNGNFLKTLTTVRFTDEIYDKVMFDYYAEQGNGFGNELNYRASGIQGSLFGYIIKPHGDPQLTGAPQVEQYNIRSYHWQRLSSALTLQSNVNLRPNISFNNRFFPQDTNQAVSDLTSSIALTHQKGRLNQRLVVERLDTPDAGDASQFATTHIQTASLPRYDLTLFQRPLWNPAAASTGTVSPSRIGPLLLSANATLGDTYHRLDRQMHANGLGSFTLSQSIRLSRQWSFNPSLTPQLNWQDKFDPQAPTPVTTSTTPVSTAGLFKGYQGRIGTADTLRWRPTSALTLDQTYSLIERLEPNGTALDRRPTDGGVDTHRLNWLLYWRPSRRVMMRSFAGFDMRKIADETLEAYRQRKWDPWTTELTLQPSRRSEYFLRYSMGYYPFRSQLWEGNYRFYGRYNTLLQTGLLYNRGAPGYLTWNNTFGLFLSPGWRVDAVIHALVPSTSGDAAVHRGSLIDEEFIVTRDMHCWEAKFVYRNIPPLSRSYSLMFNLKLGVKAERDITDQDLESQYYPWRSRPYAP